MPGQFFLYEYKVGDQVIMKKKHPCGSFSWRVERVGAEIMLGCEGCQRRQIFRRSVLEKATKQVISPSKT